ncbi:hypothetical protein AAHN97_22795 [Chitinophaga niabensis]|uniref:hypothetical protein n=1 Tax=Chitinophaga niabensis TaxID=536979 RepID=UPI0031BA7E42
MILIQSMNALNEYLNGVMNRANHHAKNVNEVALTIAGAIVWRGTEDIKVRGEKSRGAGNKLWFYVKDRRYVLSYNQYTETIDLLDGSIDGVVLHSFDNSWSAIDVKNIFEKL